MYIPKQFREERREVLVETMRSIQFGVVVVGGGVDGFDAAHIPLLVRECEDGLCLEGHIARPNRMWRRASGCCPAVAIFQGPQAYIHPGWYETKRRTGKAVPTWNYIAIHCHGELTAVDEPEWLLSHVRELSERNEAGRVEPWAVSDAPRDYIDKLLRAIVGLRILVDRIDGAWKFLQHHPVENRKGVFDALASSPSSTERALSAAMLEAEEGRSTV